MKTARWVTGIGSVILFLTGIGHCFLIVNLQKMIASSAVTAPLDGILKGSWMGFGGEMIVLAIIAMMASTMIKGGRIVLVCAATMIANAGMLLYFVGLFFGVYVSVIVAAFFLVGGVIQEKQTA
jgi:hypothetical protein